MAYYYQQHFECHKCGRSGYLLLEKKKIVKHLATLQTSPKFIDFLPKYHESCTQRKCEVV